MDLSKRPDSGTSNSMKLLRNSDLWKMMLIDASTLKPGKLIILVLYVDDILLACNDKNMLHETKNFLSSHFDTKDLGEDSYILGIEIHRDRAQGVLGLSSLY